MKNKGLIIFLIILLSLLAIGITEIMIALMQGKMNFSFFRFGHNVSSVLVIDEDYEIDFKNVKIDANSSDIYVNITNESEARVVIYGDKDGTKVNKSDGVLQIISKEKPCVGICINYEIAKIEVYLPQDYDGDIEIVNKYGDINIAEFLNANFNIDEDCGDIKIKKGKNIKVKNNYGDVTIDEAEAVEVKESAGDVKVGTARNAKIKNNYGNIKVEKITNYLNIENDCGDIELDNIELNENSSIKSSLGDIKIGHTNEIYIEASVDLGKIKINNNYQKSDITLKIDNNCGDIKVNN